MKIKHKAVLRYVFNNGQHQELKPTFRAADATYLLPATPEAYDAQAEAMGKSVYKAGDWNALAEKTKAIARLQAQVMLAAIGISRPKSK